MDHYLLFENAQLLVGSFDGLGREFRTHGTYEVTQELLYQRQSSSIQSLSENLREFLHPIFEQHELLTSDLTLVNIMLSGLLDRSAYLRRALREAIDQLLSNYQFVHRQEAAAAYLLNNKQEGTHEYFYLDVNWDGINWTIMHLTGKQFSIERIGLWPSDNISLLSIMSGKKISDLDFVKPENEWRDPQIAEQLNRIVAKWLSENKHSHHDFDLQYIISGLNQSLLLSEMYKRISDQVEKFRSSFGANLPLLIGGTWRLHKWLVNLLTTGSQEDVRFLQRSDYLYGAYHLNKNKSNIHVNEKYIIELANPKDAAVIGGISLEIEEVDRPIGTGEFYSCWIDQVNLEQINLKVAQKTFNLSSIISETHKKHGPDFSDLHGNAFCLLRPEFRIDGIKNIFLSLENLAGHKKEFLVGNLIQF